MAKSDEASKPKAVQTKLADFSHDEQCAMSDNFENYQKNLLPLRHAAYAEHVAQMTIPDAIKAWARKMEFLNLNSWLYADWCKKNETVEDPEHHKEWAKTLGVMWGRIPIIDAFMVMRYGEEPVPHWPDKFSEDDIRRANTWFTKPKGNELLNHALKMGV